MLEAELFVGEDQSDDTVLLDGKVGVDEGNVCRRVNGFLFLFVAVGVAVVGCEICVYGNLVLW